MEHLYSACLRGSIILVNYTSNLKNRLIIEITENTKEHKEN